MTEPTQACPLCDTPATYENVRKPDGKIFECPSCFEFFIDAYSEKQLASFTSADLHSIRPRLQRLARAAASDRMLVIEKAPLGEQSTGDSGVATPGIRGTYKNKS